MELTNGLERKTGESKSVAGLRPGEEMVKQGDRRLEESVLERMFSVFSLGVLNPARAAILSLKPPPEILLVCEESLLLLLVT